MIWATSTPLSVAPLLANGTMAMGTGSVTPEVMSIFSCARATPGSTARQHTRAHHRDQSRTENTLFISRISQWVGNRVPGCVQTGTDPVAAATVRHDRPHPGSTVSLHHPR